LEVNLIEFKESNRICNYLLCSLFACAAAAWGPVLTRLLKQIQMFFEARRVLKILLRVFVFFQLLLTDWVVEALPLHH
jgi:hypothetical protein